VRHVELAEGGNTVQWAVVTRVSHHGCDNPIEEEDVFVVFRGTSSVADVIAVNHTCAYTCVGTFTCMLA